MRACRFPLAFVLLPVWLAACTSTPPKPPGVFDLSDGLERPASLNGDAGRPRPGALAPPAPGSIGSSIGAPTPGRLGAGIGN